MGKAAEEKSVKTRKAAVKKSAAAALPSVADGKRDYAVPALEKGLDVLEMMAALYAPITPSQIAQRLGRSLQEVYRVVLALERRGYIVRPPGEEALVLSTQLFGLATMFPPFRRLVDAAQPILNALALEASQACHMAVLDGLNQRIVAQVDSPAPIAIRLRVGAASPAVHGASGRTILAFQPTAVQEWCFSEAAALEPPDWLTSCRKRVADIQARGYELIEGEVVHGVIDVSFPILNAEGRSLAALTMPFLTSYQVVVAFEDAAAMAHRAASRITEAMGGALSEPKRPLRRA
ncbi:MAG TPA: IclR family transcriptional regulator [Nordella sp.]|nr:IclR family transcriptional regulator [Nordella sp.]